MELEDYPELFTGLECLPGAFHKALAEEAVPVVHAPRKVPVPQRVKIVKAIKMMEELGVTVHRKNQLNESTCLL